MLPIRTILQPTDFSPASRYAFRLACGLARDYGARVVLLHAHPPELVYGEGYVLPPDPEEVRQELLQQLDEWQAPDPSVRVERVLRDGNPVEEILREAREGGCDVIVMGTHGRSGVGRLIMGSVAEVVLRKAPCPVVTVKAPRAELRTAREAETPQAVPS